MTDTEPTEDRAAAESPPGTGAPLRPDTEDRSLRGPGLGTRLFFAAALLISITLGLVLFFSTWEADRQARREIRESLQAVPQIYEGYVASQAQSRRAQVQTLAEGVGLKALLGGGADTATYHDSASELARGVGAGTVFLFDRRGVLLARSDREVGEEAGRDFSLVRWVGEPLANGKTTSAFILEIRRAHHLSLVAAAAVSQGNGAEQQIVGVVAAAFPWESSAAADLQRLLTGEVAFLGNVAARGKAPGPAVFGASPGFADATDLLAGLTADPTFTDALFVQAKMRQAFDFGSGETRYIGTALPILSGGGEPIAALVVGRSEATALAVFRRIRQAILMVGAAVLLLALPISFAVARRISRPVEQLAAAAEEVRQGRLDVALPSERTDEVGRLARAFGAMVAELREKQTLEKLVATLRAGSGQTSPDRTAPSASAPAPGQVFAHRYQTLDVLGEGGMGRVFRVLDLELDEIVALKVLGGSSVAERTRGEQFLRHELKVARAITHPNVVRVHDLGEVDGDRFLTMEYVSGTSLRRLLDQKRRLEVVPALQIASRSAAACRPSTGRASCTAT